MASSENTFVTACDSNYFWGAFLLCLSIRRSGAMQPVHVLHPDLNAGQIGQLEQLPGVHCIGTSTPHAMFQKPEAMLTAETPWVTWLDCDVIWEGQIEALFGGGVPGIQIRVRGQEENAMQFPMTASEFKREKGAVPAYTISRWRSDVGERATPRLAYMVVSNVVALHRDHRWVLERWRQLMEKVSKNPAQLVDKTNLAYRITDEAALTALLAFCERDVPILRYRLDEDPENRIVHFEGRPKPWQGWQLRYMAHYDAVAETVAWGQKHFELPPVPPSMLAANKQRYLWRAKLDAVRKGMRRQLVRAARIGTP